MKKFIYRVIREEEDVSQGLKVIHRQPALTDDERMKRIRYHVQNGSRDWYTDKYFISMTENLEVTCKYRNASNSARGTRVVLIKTEGISSDLIRMEDLVTSIEADDATLAKKIKNFSLADSEVLADQDIEPEYLKELSPLMIDVLDAINVSIVKENEESNKERALLEFIQSAYFESDELEQILQDTTELNEYEQYFFDNYYKKNNNSMKEILSEMNRAIAETGGNPLDLSTIEAMKVSTIKKLLNSDKTLEYLKRYNAERYKSDEISEQLEEAIAEKEQEKGNQGEREKKDLIICKSGILESLISKINEKIRVLYEEIVNLEKKHTELYNKYEVKNRRKNNDFIGTLEEGVISEELSGIIHKIQSIKKDIENLRKREQIYTKILTGLRCTNDLERRKTSRKLGEKYQGLTIRSYSSIWKYETALSRRVQTTATNMEKLENSNECVAIGETAYIPVEKKEELMYTEGTTKRIDKRGPVLVTFSSPRWENKKNGGKMNNERIGKSKVITSKKTSFGLRELIILIKSRDKNSEELLQKTKEEIERYKLLKSKAKEEIETERNNELRKKKKREQEEQEEQKENQED